MRPWICRVTSRARFAIALALAAIYFCLPRFQLTWHFVSPMDHGLPLLQVLLTGIALLWITLGLRFAAGEPASSRRRGIAALWSLGVLALPSFVHFSGVIYTESGTLHYLKPSLMGLLSLPSQPMTLFAIRVLPYVAILAVSLLILWVRDRRSSRSLQLAS